MAAEEACSSPGAAVGGVQQESPERRWLLLERFQPAQPCLVRSRKHLPMGEPEQPGQLVM